MAKIIESLGQRRPIKTRQAPWSSSLANLLVRLGVSPNQVSIGSLGFALAGAVSYSLAPSQTLFYIGAACCIQLRLLCNMLDGLMAVENGKKTKTGELFNELPDRLADTLFLVAAGYCCHSDLGTALGYCCALLAMMTAYIRAVGARFSPAQDFRGPMAKPHRMFALTVGSMLTALQGIFAWHAQIRPATAVLPVIQGMPIMLITLMVIALGAVITCISRTARLATTLNEGGSNA